MLNRLSITNFRGIAHLETEIDPVTALLGPNSSGKTTVLHAIRAACDLVSVALEGDGACRLAPAGATPRVIVADKLLIPDLRVIAALADWQALFVDQIVGDGIKAIIELTFDDTDPIQTLWTQLTCGRNQQIKLDVRIDSSAAIEQVEGLSAKSPRVNQLLTEAIKRSTPRAVFVPPFYGTVLNEEYRARVVIDRLLGTGDQSHVVRNLIAGLDNDRFERLSAFLNDTLGARLTYRTSGDRLQTESPLRVTFADSNGDIELSAAGAGLTNLIALYASLARWRQEDDREAMIFLLDEPEAHLAPRLQAEGAARLARLVSEEFGAQLIMATHSVDILNRLSQEGALLLRCDRTATPSVTALHGDAALFTDLATWVDLTPYTAINFLASRRVVFVEGKTDSALLRHAGRLLFRNHRVHLARFERWAFVEMTGSGNRSIPQLLSRLLHHDVIRAGGEGHPFRVEIVLDRDYAAADAPTITEDTATGVTAVTTRWLRHSVESLFIEASVLVRWIRAFLPPTLAIADLDARVTGAIAAADADPDLNSAASRDLIAEATLTLQREGVALSQDNARRLRQAIEDASQRVAAAPAIWQRGKDRARFVLAHIRDALPREARGHFPVLLEKLVLGADLNRIGDAAQAIPAELVSLLERLVATETPRRPAAR